MSCAAVRKCIYLQSPFVPLAQISWPNPLCTHTYPRLTPSSPPIRAHTIQMLLVLAKPLAQTAPLGFSAQLWAAHPPQCAFLAQLIPLTPPLVAALAGHACPAQWAPTTSTRAARPPLPALPALLALLSPQADRAARPATLAPSRARGPPHVPPARWAPMLRGFLPKAARPAPGGSSPLLRVPPRPLSALPCSLPAPPQRCPLCPHPPHSQTAAAAHLFSH